MPRPSFPHMSMQFTRTRILLVILFTVIFALGALSATGVYFYLESKKPANKFKQEQAETKQLLEKVGRMVDLPTGEQPIIASVNDVQKLKDQEIFRRAQNGDTLIVYQKAKKAILYRDRTGQIIESANMNFAMPSVSPSASPGLHSLRVMLLNGTITPGLAGSFEPEVAKILPKGASVTKDNGKKRDYKTSVIVVSNEQFLKEAELLSKELKIPIGNPEEEEVLSDSDIFIILGQDKTK